jgi:exodeoxyribonuclease-3
LLSRLPITDVARDIPGLADEQKRVIAATIGGVRSRCSRTTCSSSTTSPTRPTPR